MKAPKVHAFLSYSEDKKNHKRPWLAGTTHNKGLKLAL